MSKKSWFSAKANGDGSAADITIFSEIGGFGVTAQDFYDQLQALGNPKTINLSIASDGGDVATGFAIYNMLARHRARKIVTIEGLAASMASVVAMAGDEVVMPSNSMMMIHNPWGSIQGTSDQLASFAEALKAMGTNIAMAYRKRTGMSLGKIRQMMNAETWLTAQDAVAKNFADRVEQPMAARASFDISKFRNAPDKFGQIMKEKVMSKSENEKPAGESAEVETVTAESVKKAVLAEQAEIRSLCKIAGKPALADGFITEGKTVADVLAALATAKDAELEAAKDKGKGKSKSTEVSAHHDPRDGSGEAPEIDTVKIWDKFNSAGKRRA